MLASLFFYIFPSSWPRFLHLVQLSLCLSLCLSLYLSHRGSLLSPPLLHSDLTTCHLGYFHRLQDHPSKSKPLSHLLPPTPIYPGHASSLNFLKESLRLWQSLLWDATCSSVVLLQPHFSLHSHIPVRVACFSPYLHGHFLPLCFCTCCAPSHVSILQHAAPLRPYLILPARYAFLLYL